MNIFDRLNNTIGNHMEGKATDQDLIKIAYEIDKYLLEHPHPHGDIHHVSNCPACGSGDLFKFKLEHIKCKNCKEQFEHSC